MTNEEVNLEFDAKDYYITLLVKGNDLTFDMYPADDNESDTQNYTLLLDADGLAKFILEEGNGWV